MSAKPLTPPPSHPDLDIISAETGFARHLQVDVVRFRHRLFAGGWSDERVFDVVRRGAAVAVLLYDPDRDSIVLVEQFRLAALYGGRSPWQIENVAGLIDTENETPEEVARREIREESNLEPLGDADPDPAHPAGQRHARRGDLALLRPRRFAQRRRSLRPRRRARGHPRHRQDAARGRSDARCRRDRERSYAGRAVLAATPSRPPAPRVVRRCGTTITRWHNPGDHRLRPRHRRCLPLFLPDLAGQILRQPVRKVFPSRPLSARHSLGLSDRTCANAAESSCSILSARCRWPASPGRRSIISPASKNSATRSGMSRITAPTRTIPASAASSPNAATTSPICATRWSGTVSPDAGPIGMRSTISGTGCRARRCIAAMKRPTR